MNRKFADVRSSKKALAYGSARGMGPFRPRPKKEAPASSAKADEGGVEQTLTGPVPSYDNTNTREDAR